MQMYHINYHKPKVTLLQQTGIGVSEIAGRTCYDSFDNSENQSIKDRDYPKANDIESSELLDSLAWVHHHHSIIEHTNLSFLVEGTSRACLQEHARHRIQSISVRSTRYTMSSVINAFVASLEAKDEFGFFFDRIMDLDLFIISDREYLVIEVRAMFDKLYLQYKRVDDFISISVAKSSIEFLATYKDNPLSLFQALENGKKKRNVGDAFKHIVTDNWKVDMVITFNLRSLKNYFDLRDSGSAYFQIQWLAKAMKEVLPIKYLRLIDKESRG